MLELEALDLIARVDSYILRTLSFTSIFNYLLVALLTFQQQQVAAIEFAPDALETTFQDKPRR